MKRISDYSLALTALIANAVVILQGALVRATGSGAGCGRHWPTCNGSPVPLNPTLETGIEFSHRLLSFGVLLLGAWLLVRARRAGAKRRGFRLFATISFALLVFEALIGGATVILGMTGDNTSVARGIWVASHLVNSLLLIGALAVTVVYSRGRAPAWPLAAARQKGLTALLLTGLVGMLVLSFTGGIAAMGNTMFPSDSLAAGLRADFDPGSHPLIRLRALHPLIAILVGVYLFVALAFSRRAKPAAPAGRLAAALLMVYVLQMLVGVINLALLAPTLLQLLHLLVGVAAFALLAAYSVVLLGSPAKDALSTESARSPRDGGPAGVVTLEKL